MKDTITSPPSVLSSSPPSVLLSSLSPLLLLSSSPTLCLDTLFRNTILPVTDRHTHTHSLSLSLSHTQTQTQTHSSVKDSPHIVRSHTTLRRQTDFYHRLCGFDAYCCSWEVKFLNSGAAILMESPQN